MPCLRKYPLWITRIAGLTLGASREIFCNQCQTRGMSKSPDYPPSGRIVISLHQLFVEVEHESSYPDQISDLSNRALDIFKLAIDHCKEIGMDIRSVDPFIFDGEDDDED